MSEIHIHNHVHLDLWDPRVDGLIELIEAQHKQEEQTMSDFSDAVADLRTELSSNTDVVGSVVQLVNQLADEVEANIGDATALQELVDGFRTNDSTLADLVVANTPAQPGPEPEPTPEPAPEPEPVEGAPTP